MAGSLRLDEFVDHHFSRVGKNVRTNSWSMKCRCCTQDTIIEHRELRCTVHLPKYEQCPNAPDHVRKEALQRLTTKRGVLSSVPIDELRAPSNLHVVGDDDSDNNGVVCKKG